jgi:hypothetical protein
VQQDGFHFCEQLLLLRRELRGAWVLRHEDLLLLQLKLESWGGWVLRREEQELDPWC